MKHQRAGVAAEEVAPVGADLAEIVVVLRYKNASNDTVQSSSWTRLLLVAKRFRMGMGPFPSQSQ